VLASDGVIDIFGGGEGLGAFVAESRTQNPQELAEAVLDYCVRADRLAPHDDMTVISARIFARR